MARVKHDNSTSSDVIVCNNPATGALLGEVAVTTSEQAAAAVARAREGFGRWRMLPLEDRIEALLRARDLLLERLDDVIDLLSEETGKVRTDTVADVLPLCDAIRYYTSNADKLLRERTLRVHIAKHKQTRVAYHPRGVILNISPWNFPIDLSFSPAVAALVAGNAVIIKPSEVTPLIVQFVAGIFHEAGVPRDVLQVLPGYGATGAALVPLVDFVSFTGSVATGRRVAVACAEQLTPYTLELGGKDPAIVLDDADLDRASAGIVWGAFLNSGQICQSIERVYVVDSIADEFIQRVVDRTRALRQGSDAEGGELHDVGSMTFPRQIEIIEAHIEDAREKGAKVLIGGQRLEGREGAWFAPTVLVDVTHDMRIMREETFGPVLPIMRVKDGEEGLRLANDSEFGLASSVWGRDTARCAGIARRLEAGAVNINDVMINYSITEAPFGGVKNSGIGRRHGVDEIRKFCHSQTLVEDIFQLKSEPVWYPYSATKLGMTLRTVKALFQRGFSQKIRALMGR